MRKSLRTERHAATTATAYESSVAAAIETTGDQNSLTETCL